MKRLFIALAILSTPFSMRGQEMAASNSDSVFTPYYKYRVSLKDKSGTGYSINHPEKFLSAKSIERRKRQGLQIDESDLPVSKKYIDKIRKAGVRVVHTSKWNNTVLIQTTDTSLVGIISSFPFVTNVRKVATYTKAPKLKNTDRSSMVSKAASVGDTLSGLGYYGKAENQIKQLHGDALHDQGYRGSGMTIAIIDAGFHNVDIIPMLQNVKILGIKDFGGNDEDIYALERHGLMVLSCIGMNQPYYMVGTAPEASFYLLRSEDSDTEQLVEEDNWCAAVEYADSVGADLINSSLGYTLFDNPLDNVEYWEQDGKTHLNSRSASLIASKGMVLCNSAGNSGSQQWKRIGVPADADHILAVGALTPKGKNTNFSSVGNSADGRVKPDVCAQGENCSLMGSYGNLTTANGTSFSSPILCGMVACYWQAHPHLTSFEVIEAIQRLGDRYEHPDNVYGYGLPDFSK